MTDQPAPVYHLALRDWHAGRGASFGERAGWSLPLHYGDWKAEHTAIRQGVALLDRSNRSRILVSGTDALDVLKATFAGHVEDLEEGRSMRSVILGDDGTIRDLALVARTGGISFFVMGEPGCRFETVERLRAAIQPDWDARVDDRTETTCMLGIAGPGAAQAMQEALEESLPGKLPSLHVALFQFHGFRTLGMRTSDTGEDGFELMLAPAVMQHLLDTLVEMGARPVGYEAQEVARIEACVPAFEPDLLPGLSPAEADLDALLDVPGGTEERILSALLFEGDEIPEAGVPAYADSGAVAGELRSAAFSPTLQAVIGLALLPAGRSIPGERVRIGKTNATVVAKPFLRRRTAS
jgi:aminomethyltransferase